MKKHIFILGALLTVIPNLVKAQSLNVNIGNGVSYSFDAANTGLMEYSDGETLTINGIAFNLSEIESLTVSDDVLEDNTVLVSYNGSEAAVRIAYNIMDYVEASVSGANVTIDQSKEVGDDTGEITYRLKGASSEGSFLLNGSYKCGIELDGLTLTNPKGASIDIQNGKRIAMRVITGTENTLIDGPDGDQKGCIVCKGHLEFKQKGVLNVTGKTSHAIYAKEYVEIKNATINILGSMKDGISCAQYFLMESGSLNISGVGDDGIQCDYKDSEDREDEDTGTIEIQDGMINIVVTADASKGLKSEGNFVISGGDVTISSSGGGIWDADKQKTKAASCISADENGEIKGGSLNLKASGGGGKGISCDGGLYVSGGEITVLTTGGLLAYVNGTLNQNYTGNTDRINSDYKSSPKAIKIDGDIVIDGGTFDLTAKGNGGEGIESKSNLTINGGDIKIRAYDDGTNSTLDTTITGGNLDVMSTGNADGIDSNSSIYISGGYLRIFGGRQPEEGLDVDNGSVVFTGGEILAVGGANSVPSSSNNDSTQPYLSMSQIVGAGSTVSVSDGSETLVSFEIPEDYNPEGGNNGQGGWSPFSETEPGDAPMMAPGGGGFGGGFGNKGGALVISCPGLVKGNTYTVTIGSEIVNATAQ